jgi:hypothetical protein
VGGNKNQTISQSAILHLKRGWGCLFKLSLSWRSKSVVQNNITILTVQLVPRRKPGGSLDESHLVALHIC